MTIHAVNTLEIKAAPGAADQFHLQLVELVSAFKRSPGCFAYEVTRSAQEADLWLVSGFWTDEAAMREHICSPAFGSMIWSLGCSAISVRFNSFLPDAMESDHASR